MMHTYANCKMNKKSLLYVDICQIMLKQLCSHYEKNIVLWLLANYFFNWCPIVLEFVSFIMILVWQCCYLFFFFLIANSCKTFVVCVSGSNKKRNHLNQKVKKPDYKVAYVQLVRRHTYRLAFIKPFHTTFAQRLDVVHNDNSISLWYPGI